MRVSTGVEWAMHTAVLLAQAPEGAWTSRRTIAEFYDLPEPYLAKYLRRLVAAGVLVAPLGTARHSGGTSRTGAKRLTCTSSCVSLHLAGTWVRRRVSHAAHHR